MATKFIFVTGGVVSSLGKGITAASLGRLLKSRGHKVAMQKFDPYINLNPGLMSPLQHGEVFVTEDGGECDLDIGHYERFIDENLTGFSDVTSGQIYQTVINKERQGDYNGGTVQVIPHITNEIKKCVFRVAKQSGADVMITEIGGTVGDIEGLPYLEAVRQIKTELGSDCLCIHVTLVPYIGAAGEMKTKPTQHSVKELRQIGIQPDIIVTRCEMELSDSLKAKIALFCNVDAESVIPNYDAETLYDVPMMLQREGLDAVVCRKLGLEDNASEMGEWAGIVNSLKTLQKSVKIAIVGKYVDLHDAYLSIDEALSHAGIPLGTRVDISWIYSGDITSLEKAKELLGGVAGIVMPYGFGERGMQGMITAAQYARVNDVPFFAMGMGMQMAAVEFARNVCGLEGADTTEQDPRTPHPIVSLMADYKDQDTRTKDTMRLGGYRCALKEGTRIRAIYEKPEIYERHRHRYEINPEYEPLLEENGMVISGRCPDYDLAEAFELPGNRWYIGVQFHAEFASRPNRPHPLFVSFISAAMAK